MESRLWRKIELEFRVMLGPEFLLPLVALFLITAMHAFSAAHGPESWRRLFTENCESFLPLGLALATVPLWLRDAERGSLEVAIAMPSGELANLRLLILLGGGALISLMWLMVLNVLWGPVAFWQGLFAAIGPLLWLCGISLYAATVSGRATVGYLVAIGWALMDLVLRLLGAFSVLSPLQLVNLFSYRWPVVGLSWQVVTLVQAVFGAALLLWLPKRARQYWRRLL